MILTQMLRPQKRSERHARRGVLHVSDTCSPCLPLFTRDPQGESTSRAGPAGRCSANPLAAAVTHGARGGCGFKGGKAMMCQISISEDGDVTAIIDTESADDDEASRLAGLALDDMLARAAETAISTWFRIRTDEADGDGCTAD